MPVKYEQLGASIKNHGNIWLSATSSMSKNLNSTHRKQKLKDATKNPIIPTSKPPNP
jgi:hypothetical protein